LERPSYLRDLSSSTGSHSTLFSTCARSTERGGVLYRPRTIFPEKIDGMIFVSYSRRGPAFDLLLSFVSISLLEMMIQGEMTLIIKNFGEKDVRQVTTAALAWYYAGPGAQKTCGKTQLATPSSEFQH